MTSNKRPVQPLGRPLGPGINALSTGVTKYLEPQTGRVPRLATPLPTSRTRHVFVFARGLNFSKYKQARYRVRVLRFQSKGPGMNFSARADTTFNLKDPARTSSLSAHSCRVLNFGTRRSNLRTRHVFTFSVQWPFPTFSPFFPFLFPFPSFPSPFLSLFLLFPLFLPLSPFFLSHFFCHFSPSLWPSHFYNLHLLITANLHRTILIHFPSIHPSQVSPKLPKIHQITASAPSQKDTKNLPIAPIPVERARRSLHAGSFTFEARQRPATQPYLRPLHCDQRAVHKGCTPSPRVMLPVCFQDAAQVP